MEFQKLYYQSFYIKNYNIVHLLITPNLLINTLIFLSIILLIIDVSLDSPNNLYISIILKLISLIFVLEIVTKIISYGYTDYVSDKFNVLDIIVTFVLFIGELVFVVNLSHFMVVIKLVRLLNLFKGFIKFKLIIVTFKSIINSFTYLFILLICLMYVYSIVGMLKEWNEW